MGIIGIVSVITLMVVCKNYWADILLGYLVLTFIVGF